MAGSGYHPWRTRYTEGMTCGLRERGEASIEVAWRSEISNHVDIVESINILLALPPFHVTNASLIEECFNL
jgi:hypothetical protein